MQQAHNLEIHLTPAPSMIPKILLLVEQIRPRATEIYNLRTSVSILLQPCAFKAVECIRYSFTTADNAFILVVAERAFVADSHERSRTDVGVADGTFAVAFVAETADGDARGFAAHDEIWMMARHYYGIRFDPETVCECDVRCAVAVGLVVCS